MQWPFSTWLLEALQVLLKVSEEQAKEENLCLGLLRRTDMWMAGDDGHRIPRSQMAFRNFYIYSFIDIYINSYIFFHLLKDILSKF